MVRGRPATQAATRVAARQGGTWWVERVCQGGVSLHGHRWVFQFCGCIVACGSRPMLPTHVGRVDCW